MPPPHEEIHTLNEKKNSPDRIVAEELRTTWLKERWRYEDETTGATRSKNADYDAVQFKQEFQQQWKPDVEQLISRQDTRWDDEKKKLPDLKTFDEGKHQYADIRETSLKAIYSELVEKFGDQKVFGGSSSSFWDLPVDQKTKDSWNSLLGRTASEVQRNAGDLASVVANNRSLASGEISRALGKAGKSEREKKEAVANWEKSPLYKELGSLETALRNWDEWLGKGAFSDEASLKHLADECKKAFDAVSVQHGLAYFNKETVPFIKYELLAALRSLAEKVASRLAFHVGKPSFTAMYERIGDVPHRGSRDQDSAAKLVAEGPDREQYEQNPGSIWDSRLTKLDSLLLASNSDAAVELALKLGDLVPSTTLNQPMSEALNAWSKGYNEGAKKLGRMREAVGEIAFGLQKYKEAVDHILMKDKYKSDSKVRQLRLEYQRLFDGWAWQIQKEVALCAGVA